MICIVLGHQLGCNSILRLGADVSQEKMLATRCKIMSKRYNAIKRKEDEKKRMRAEAAAEACEEREKRKGAALNK